MNIHSPLRHTALKIAENIQFNEFEASHRVDDIPLSGSFHPMPTSASGLNIFNAGMARMKIENVSVSV